MSTIQQIKDQNFNQTINNAQGPVLVDFWAEWCGPCKVMSPVLEHLASELEGTVSITKVDVDANPQTAQRYNIRSIPTLILFNNGEPIAQRSGAASQKQVRAFIEQALN